MIDYAARAKNMTKAATTEALRLSLGLSLPDVMREAVLAELAARNA